MNLMNYRYAGGPPTNANLTAVALACSTAWAGTIVPLVTSANVLTGIEILDLSSPSAAEGFWSGAQTGTKAGPALPAAACMVISRQFQRRYRGGHSRTYFSGLADGDQQDTQIWSATTTNNWLGAMNGLDADIEAAINSNGMSSGDAVSVSYYAGFSNFTEPSGRVRSIPQLRTVPLVDTVTGFVARASIGSQRRRSLFTH